MFYEMVASDSNTEAWDQSLRQLIADLDSLNRETEQDFLRTGEQLGEFMRSVDLISTDLSTLTNWETGLHTSRALTHSLDRAMAMNSLHTDCRGELGEMRHEAGVLKQTLSGFKNIGQTFHAIGLLTRIETMRLGSAGREFSELADDVEALVTNVQVKVDSALAIAGSLVPPIEKAMQEIASREGERKKRLPALISGTRSSLSSLRKAQSQGQESSLRLGGQSKAISDAFKKLIVSLQFHDITHQQIEHVTEALRHLLADSANSENGILRRQPEVAILLRLQSSQLGDAAEKFAVAVASVMRNLDDVGARVLTMVEEGRTLSGLSEDGNDSFFRQIERGCAAILASMVDCKRAETVTLAARRYLAETIGRLRDPIQQIEEFEYRMHLVAINARICASSLGQSGAVLRTLADSMKDRAAEFRQSAAALGKTLDGWNEAAYAAAAPDAPSAAGEPENPDLCLEEMRTAVKDLHESTEQTFLRIAQVVTRGNSLVGNISQIRHGFAVGAVLSDTINRARRTLEDLERGLQKDVSCSVGIANDSKLAEFANQYTMQAEREVHLGVTGMTQASIEPRSQTPGAIYQDTREIQGNIEFF